MAESRGWVKIDRQIQNHWLWEDEPFSMGQAWIDLIMLANHEDGKLLCGGNLMAIKRGQKWTSIRKLATRWQWGHPKVMKFLNALEEDGMIVAEKTTNGTLLTIVNYGKFQDYKYTDDNADEHADEHANGTMLERCRNANVTQTTNINNENNENKRENAECSLAAEVIKYFNDKTGRQYNPASKGVVQNLLTRIREGHTLEEFKHVIDVKVEEWTGTKMDSQIRPSVLFGNHFDEYLNQDIKKPREDEDAGQRESWSSEFFPE